MEIPSVQFVIAAVTVRNSFREPLADGVKVAQGSLEPLVMVRIHVGQPDDPHSGDRENGSTWPPWVLDSGPGQQRQAHGGSGNERGNGGQDPQQERFPKSRKAGIAIVSALSDEDREKHREKGERYGECQ